MRGLRHRRARGASPARRSRARAEWWPASTSRTASPADLDHVLEASGVGGADGADPADRAASRRLRPPRPRPRGLRARRRRGLRASLHVRASAGVRRPGAWPGDSASGDGDRAGSWRGLRRRASGTASRPPDGRPGRVAGRSGTPAARSGGSRPVWPLRTASRRARPAPIRPCVRVALTHKFVLGALFVSAAVTGLPGVLANAGVDVAPWAPPLRGARCRWRARLRAVAHAGALVHESWATPRKRSARVTSPGALAVPAPAAFPTRPETSRSACGDGRRTSASSSRGPARRGAQVSASAESRSTRSAST